jgi:flagellar hook-length control protein FliK
MTITALVSPLAAKALASSHAAAQTGASGAADAVTDGDFGALLENHIRSAAVSIEAASDLPAAPALAKRDAPVEEGSPGAAPDAAALLAVPLQMAPVAAVTPLPAAAAPAQANRDATVEQGSPGAAPDAAALLAVPLQLAPRAAAAAPAAAELQFNAVTLQPDAVAQRSKLADLVAESSEGGAVLPQSGKAVADIAVSGRILPLTAVEIAAAPKIDVRPAKTPDVDLIAQVRPESLIPSPAPHATQGQAHAALMVEPKVGTPGWDGALGQKVLWMATRQQQVAEMHLNPPNLGPLEVRLTISNDQASAQFVSHHPAVREAIEAALPRLREMLADSGITLGNVQVGSESFAQSRAFDQGDARSPGQGSSLPAQVSEPLHVSAGMLAMPREGMVDTFA